MGVKEGYKQTEVGVIPEEWGIRPLGNLADIQRGASPRPIDSPLWFDAESKVGWVRITDVTQAKSSRLKATSEFLSPAGIANSRFLPTGSLIMSICATVGVPVITAIDTCIHDGFVGFSKLQGTTNEYMYFVLKSLEKEFRASGQIGSQSNLNSDIVRNQKVPLPPLPEQRAIAAALSDADELIAGLEALVAKKRAIKQGAMQQLLTGRKRLPGFEGEWEEKRLGDVAKIKTGGANNEDKSIDGAYPFFVRSENIERINSYSFEGEAILVPGEGNIGSIFHYINGKFDYHQRVYKISGFSSTVFAKYIHLYMSFHFGPYAAENSVKATVDSLRLPTFQNFLLQLPPLPEQQAIAAVLSDMDTEIESLEEQLGKTRALKQGMMQELLTGRIRLV